jgi:hypothetical protein
MATYIKRTIFVALLSLFAYLAFAPDAVVISITLSSPIEPYRKLINAIGIVETSNDTLAFNPEEKAVGFLQIRPVRVQDYNEKTGSNYTINDMHNYKISEKIFLYYATKIGPYDFEKIARNWNGSGKKTLSYWSQVKKYL